MDDHGSAVCDPRRLQALRATALLDSPVEESFDRLTSLGAHALRAPVAMVSLLGERRHYVKSAYGLPAAAGRDVPFTHSFCRHVVASGEPLVVADAREVPELRDNLAIGEYGVIAYLGMPLTTPDGCVLGTFCVIDRQPRPWLDHEIGVIADLAATAMFEIGLRCEMDAARRARTVLERAHRAQQERVGECRRQLDEAQRRLREEEAVRAKAAALERSNADLEQFAYLASHDLQEPLRMVTGFLSLVQRRAGGLDAQTAEWIASAIDGAQRMQRLIHDLLAYARVDTVPRTGGTCRSGEALDEALRILGGRIALAQARVEHGPLPDVACCHSQLVQVFQNLVANAVKYRSQRPPRIRIEAAAADGQVEFAVHDNGIGIEPEFAPLVFDLFRRLPGPGPRGTGLGLAICKRIVERHGGRIGVEPGADGGSVFRFTLPAAER